MNILDCIGHTPLVRLERVSHMLGANIFVKLEPRNPAGPSRTGPRAPTSRAP